MYHKVIYVPPDRFAGWPANNGLWYWGDEILVGCSVGAFEAQQGHNVGKEIRSVLIRSRDGGETWAAVEPEGYLNAPRPLSDLDRPLDFSVPDFALRVFGAGYHGTDEPRGGFLTSQDRGVTWQGPYRFNGLIDQMPLRGLQMTPRTDYLVENARTCLLFLSARDPDVWGSDRVFVARTGDSGLSFEFVSWIVPPSDPYRAVMPSTMRAASSATDLISAVRRRDMRANEGWIDAYGSTDNGTSWSFLSRVGEAGGWNGNPPALVWLRDGRLCCIYGNRTRRQMLARFSSDQGHNWRDEVVLRDDFCPVDDEPDFGYPRLTQRADGSLVAVYYWASSEHRQQHIATTIWKP